MMAVVQMIVRMRMRMMMMMMMMMTTTMVLMVITTTSTPLHPLYPNQTPPFSMDPSLDVQASATDRWSVFVLDRQR